MPRNHATLWLSSIKNRHECFEDNRTNRTLKSTTTKVMLPWVMPFHAQKSVRSSGERPTNVTMILFDLLEYRENVRDDKGDALGDVRNS